MISTTPKQTQIVLKYAYDYLFTMAVCFGVVDIKSNNTFLPKNRITIIITMVSGIVELITRVSAALILPHYMGVYGIYLAEVLAWTSAAIMLYIFYYKDLHQLDKGVM